MGHNSLPGVYPRGLAVKTIIMHLLPFALHSYTNHISFITPFTPHSSHHYTPLTIEIYSRFPLPYHLVVEYASRHCQPVISRHLILAYAGRYRLSIVFPRLFMAYAGRNHQPNSIIICCCLLATVHHLPSL